MKKKKYIRPESLVLAVHSEYALMQYSKIKNGTDETIQNIRDEKESTDFEVN